MVSFYNVPIEFDVTISRVMAGKVYEPEIEAIIFDCDGVILDTLPLYHDALAKFVPPPFPQELYDLVNGVSDRQACKIFVEFFKMDMTPEELFEKRRAVLEEMMAHAPLIPGVDRVIRDVKEKGLPMAVATSCMRHVHDIKMSGHPELFSLFDVVVCGDEVTEAKPSPVIFQTASNHLGHFDPKHVLVFEDSIHGIKAANAAGMPVVFFNKDSNDPAGASPTVTIKEFKEFSCEMFNWAQPRK